MRHRLHLVIAGSLGALLSPGTAALAHDPLGPVVYGAAPFHIGLPPAGYVLDPADARRPIYVVNQGPSLHGPGIVAIKAYAVPTYSEGAYAYALPYPYIGGYLHGYGDWSDAPGYAPVYRPPYWRGRIHRLDDAVGYGPHVYRRHVFRPHAGAYRYRPAPRARVIDVRDQRAAPPPMPQARPQQPPSPGTPPVQAPPPAQPGQPDASGHAR